jgi:hypothetical protein
MLTHVSLEVWVSRTQTFMNHTNRETTCHHCACCITHTVHITFHVLHNAMEWEAIRSIVGEWKFWNSAFLEAEQHTHHTSLYIYIKHFTFQAIFLKALLLMQTEQSCDCIHYLIKHIIMKAWVKLVDSILHQHK